MQLRDVLDRDLINVVRTILQCCTNAMRSMVQPTKEVAHLIRNRLEGVVAYGNAGRVVVFMTSPGSAFAVPPVGCATIAGDSGQQLASQNLQTASMASITYALLTQK